jgi:AraC-like DNA-binding protein
MENHLDEKTIINLLCSRFNLSATSLKQLFRQITGCGVNQRFSSMRHHAAKRLIRDGRISMKAIADKCGYGSIHYFSRRFSQMEGMSPSEYARSVKSKTE